MENTQSEKFELMETNLKYFRNIEISNQQLLTAGDRYKNSSKISFIDK